MLRCQDGDSLTGSSGDLLSIKAGEYGSSSEPTTGKQSLGRDQACLVAQVVVYAPTWRLSPIHRSDVSTH